MPEVQPKEIQRYTTQDNRVPFEEWLNVLRDGKAKARIKLRLDRFLLGNLGDYRFVGEGVYELKIDYGPGYRIYFGQVGTTIILLLIGGDKSTQDRDLRQAIKYWTDYRSEDNA